MSGVTNYPNRVSSGGTVVTAGVAAIVGAGTVNTGMDSVVAVNASLAAAPGTAGGSAVIAYGVPGTGGNVVLRTVQGDYVTAGTVSQNVAWIAAGAQT